MLISILCKAFEFRIIEEDFRYGLCHRGKSWKICKVSICYGKKIIYDSLDNQSFIKRRSRHLHKGISASSGLYFWGQQRKESTSKTLSFARNQLITNLTMQTYMYPHSNFTFLHARPKEDRLSIINVGIRDFYKKEYL